MSQSQRVVKTPVIVLCYGIISPDNQRLFAISHQDGFHILPLFTDFELAEKFRQYHNDALLKATLPISITGATLGGDSVDVLPEQIALCVVQQPQQLTDMLMLVHIKERMVYLTINPTPNSQLLCYEMDEISISAGSGSDSNTV